MTSHMRREIAEQPAAVAATPAADVDGLERDLAAAGSPVLSIGPGRPLPAAEGLTKVTRTH
jgi:hypothetical protein